MRMPSLFPFGPPPKSRPVASILGAPRLRGMTTETSVIVVGAAIVRGDAVLCARRSAPESLAGKWEFPGGKVEAGERDQDAVVREGREGPGIEVAVGGPVGARARM